MRYERESQQGQADAELNLAAEDEAILVDFFARQRTEDPTDGGANDIFDSNAAFATLPVASRHALFQAATENLNASVMMVESAQDRSISAASETADSYWRGSRLM